nr:MAG TPA_asm: hypothetical protein [Caudoviricetes sp.]
MGAGCFLSLFYFFGGRKTDRAGLGGGCMPRRWRPQPPARPGRLRSTGSTRIRAGAGMHSACMLRVQRFYALVRLILNILLTCTFNHV